MKVRLVYMLTPTRKTMHIFCLVELLPLVKICDKVITNHLSKVYDDFANCHCYLYELMHPVLSEMCSLKINVQLHSWFYQRLHFGFPLVVR